MTDGITEANKRVRCCVCNHDAPEGECVRAIVADTNHYAHDACAVFAFRQATIMSKWGALSKESREIVEQLIKVLS